MNKKELFKAFGEIQAINNRIAPLESLRQAKILEIEKDMNWDNTIFNGAFLNWQQNTQ